MKLIAIGGEPAVGKTTIVRQFIKDMKPFTYGLVKGYYNGNKYIVGTYKGHKFDGTDRLSMAAQPEFIRFLGWLGHYSNNVVLFEGDRLFNKSLFEVCRGIGLYLLIIEASDETKATRHTLRGDEQSDRFLKAKKTKLENIMSALPCTRMQNNTVEEQIAIMTLIQKWLYE